MSLPFFFDPMFILALGFSLSMLAASLPDDSWPTEALGNSFSVKFTHCGSGSTCGGHQHCTHYEIALSDASIWRSLGVGPMSGGYDHCPGGNWEDCCRGSHNGVCTNLPTCPLDDKPATAYPVCLGHGSKAVTAYVTGCCPSHHPCNICKAEKHMPGACTQEVNQADLCDNVWHALGSPSQSGSLALTIGACSAPPPTPRPEPCKDVAPDDKYTCEQQKGFGKCDKSWMKGFCCKTCFDCESGCGNFESAGSLHHHGSEVESTNVTRNKRQDGLTNITRNKHHYGDPKGLCITLVYDCVVR